MKIKIIMAENIEKKQWFMKQGHGSIFVADQLVIGIKKEKTEDPKRPKVTYIPLTKEQVDLFTDAQKKQYLELR